MENNVKIFLAVLGILVVGVVVTAVIRSGGGGTTVADDRYNEFTTCLADQGAVFYGAFWCPHCQSQKKMFGSADRLLPYVECSLPSGQGQTQECIEKDISSYPTWEFADGTRMMGEIPLAQLAEKTGCVLPEGEDVGQEVEVDAGASSSAVTE